MEAAEAKPRRTKKVALKKHGFDFPLFIAIVVVCAFGLVMLYSASYYYALTKHGDGMYFLKRQIIFVGIGMTALLGLSHLKFDFYRNKAVVILSYVGVVAFGFILSMLSPYRTKQMTKSILLFPIFTLSWMPLCFAAMIVGGGSWEQIKHKRAVTLGELGYARAA